MNKVECEDFRESKLATPQELGAGAHEHLTNCAECAAFSREVDAFEKRLHCAAMVVVPDGLAEQIILRHRKRIRGTRFGDWLSGILADSRTRWFLPTIGAAAALMLAVAALVANTVLERQKLADVIIAHVVSEPQVLLAAGTVEPERLGAALARYGAVMHEPVGQVRHLGNCVIDGKVAQHVLVQTPYGAVTLILVPGEPTSSGLRTRDGFTATVVPLKNGSLGIVTRSPDSAKKAKELIQHRVTVES